MTKLTGPNITKACLSAMVQSIRDAARTSSLVLTCIEVDDDERAFEIALDIELQLNEANSLLRACSILKRRLNDAQD